MFTSFLFFFIMATVLGERGVSLFVYDRYMAFTLAKIVQLSGTSQYLHSVIISTSQNLFCKAKGPATCCVFAHSRKERKYSAILISQLLVGPLLWTNLSP